MTKTNSPPPIFEKMSEADTLLDSQQTTAQSVSPPQYRTFLASGMKADIQFAENIYAHLDQKDGTTRQAVFNSCKSDAWFQVHLDSREVRVQARSCGLRWCPFCIKSRRYVITESVIQYLQNHSRTRFITLTLRHRSAPLKDQINDLYYFFRQLRKTKLWKSNVAGGVWFFQVKRSKDGKYWHPHLHVLTDGKYFPQEELKELWRQITKGSYIVDIRAVKSVKTAAQYVARYASAPCRLIDLEFVQAVECVEALKGRRLCGTFGTAKGIPLRPVPQADKAEWVTLESFRTVHSGIGVDQVASALWQCWTNKEPYWGELPHAPPDVAAEVAKIVEAPTSFNQMFFTYQAVQL